MSFLTALPIIGKVLNKGLDVIDKLVTDKDLANKLKKEITSEINKQDHDEFVAELRASTEVIITEAKGGWLQKNWRPGLMALFGIIIANNYILNPWLSALFSIDIKMEIPPDMWQLLKLGIGGYVGGRSIEKVVGVWKSKP